MRHRARADHERVETTDAKAKELRRIADRMITLGKRGDLHARRRAMRIIRVRNVAAKVFGELAERYRTRPGGYTRVLKTRRRTGDAAGMSIVETASRKKEEATVPVKKKVTEKAASKKAGAKKAASKKAASKKKTAKKATRKKATTSKASAKKSAKPKKPRAKAD
jgi:large subunit ribosomal protein L17